MPQKKKILVLFYSLTGATAQLAKEVAAGASGITDTEVMIKRVPEIIPDEFFEKNKELAESRKKLEAEFPVATIDDLLGADGVAFGTPVHFGSFASQLKQFIDQLSPIWEGGKMINKPAAVFCASGSIHGGEEVTLMSLMIPLFNLGMIPVGIPYPIQGESQDFDAGSPYGAIFVTGHDGKNPLSEPDKHVAQVLGRRLAAMTQFLNCECGNCKTAKALARKVE